MGTHGKPGTDARGAFVGRLLRALVWTLGGFVGLLAVLLLGAWVSSRWREQQEAPSVSKSEKVLRTLDLRMHYTELGPETGKVILLVHGTGAYGEFWRETMLRMADAGYRTIAVDLPPFGFSEKPARGRYGNAEQAARIVSLMDQLGLGKVTLLGHSFGGGATLETALAVPERVEALILEDIGGLHLDEENGRGLAEWFLRTPVLRDPLVALTATNPLFTRKLLTSMVYDPSVVTESHLEILRRPLSVRGSTHALGDWLHEALYPERPSRTSLHSNYARLTMPALLLWGENDTVIPLAEGRRLEALLPRAHLVTLARVNHIPHIENREATIELALRFLEANGIAAASR